MDLLYNSGILQCRKLCAQSTCRSRDHHLT